MKVTALLPHLIGIRKTRAWLTSPLETMKQNLRSHKEPQPSRVLYIGPSKRLNDYYASMV
jgi:hypothetical protein